MRARVTVVEQVVLQSDDGTKVLADRPFSHELESTEQPWNRVLTIGDEWQPLDLGWVGGNCYLLLIDNLPVKRDTYPTDEERCVERKAVVEVAQFSNTFMQVPVGERCRIYPVGQFNIRCASGRAKVVITAVAK